MIKIVLACIIAFFCCVSCSRDNVSYNDNPDSNIKVTVLQEPNDAIPNADSSGYQGDHDADESDDYPDNSYCIASYVTPIMTDDIHGEYKWVYIFQVFGCSDKDKERKINEALEANERWSDKGMIYEAGTSYPVIYCHSSRYLSVMNYRWFEQYPPNSLYYYLTIDMQSGEKVRLDDLIEFSQEFIEYLRFGQFIEPEWPEFDAPSKTMQDWLITLTDDEIIKELIECSKDQTDFYDNAEDKYNIYPMFYRNAFYVEDNRLIIVFSKSNESECSLIAHVNDIEEFLKVPKW